MANNGWTHTYHAEAHALSGSLQLPVRQEIQPQVFAKFYDDKDGYYSEQAKPYRLEGVISYQSAYSQASGHRSLKGHGFVTLATAVVEKLNVLEIVTADRIVAQISTEHPEGPGAPTVTFLGTHFDNLQIAGHRAEVDLDLNFVGDRPEGITEEGRAVAPYIAPGSVFTNAVSKLYDNLHASLGEAAQQKLDDRDLDEEQLEELGRRDYPSWIRKKYDKRLITAQGIAAQGENAKVRCSLVKSLRIAGMGKPFVHSFHLPNFGRISLADLTVNNNSFNLTMVNLHLGCLADGTIGVGTNNVNGGGGTH